MTRAHRLAAIAAVIVLGPLAAGCSASSSPRADASTTTTTATSTSTTTTVERPTVTVLDAGAEPRRQLEMALHEGDEARVTFTTDLAIEQEAGGQTQRLDSPPISEVMRLSVGTVTDAGAEVTLEVEAVSVQRSGSGLSDGDVAALERTLRTLVGLRATGTMLPDGSYQDMAFHIPKAAVGSAVAQLGDLGSMVTALSPPLPPEPVGVGARWRVDATAAVKGIRTQTSTTFEVTALQEATVGYTSTVTTSAGAQELTTGLPAGTTGQLVSSRQSGTGKGVIHLTSPAADFSVRTTGTQAMRLTSDGETVAVTQHLSLAQATRTEAG